MDELLPCPFCGSADIELHHEHEEKTNHVLIGSMGEYQGPVLVGDKYSIHCENCCAGVTAGDRDQAVAAWNTRKEPAQ